MFATAACLTAILPVVEVGDGHDAACLHTGRLGDQGEAALASPC